MASMQLDPEVRVSRQLQPTMGMKHGWRQRGTFGGLPGKLAPGCKGRMENGRAGVFR